MHMVQNTRGEISVALQKKRDHIFTDVQTVLVERIVSRVFEIPMQQSVACTDFFHNIWKALQFSAQKLALESWMQWS
jgi:hypothetical protein